MSTITLLPVKGYDCLYEVDSIGNVYSCVKSKGRRKDKLKPCERNGYLYVNLYKDRKATKHYIHRIVAEAFISNPNGFKEVNHINCDKHDNSVNNLEWCDRKYNLKHSYEHGLKRRGEGHGMHKLSENDVVYIKSKRGIIPQKTLAEKYGVKQCTISAIQCGRTWKEVMSNVKS